MLLLTSKAVNWLRSQYRDVNAVLLLTSKVVN